MTRGEKKTQESFNYFIAFKKAITLRWRPEKYVQIEIFLYMKYKKKVASVDADSK
jgi:hypothetical protein